MIPMAVPNLTGNERKYLDDCIETTFVSSVGEYVTRFEQMVASATGSMYAVATSAGTTGLHAALTAIGVSCGDLVIIPTFTFIASANAIAHCGALPWCMDVREEDWCLDPSIVQKEIEENCEYNNGVLVHIKTGRRVAAIMPVYTLGNIPNMEELRAISNRYDLPLIVDAACAIGAKYKGEDFGGLADLSVLSFNGNKTITCGGGGAVVGNDEKLLSLVRHLTTTARVWPDYEFDMVGFNYRMTNIQAAVGCAQMERLDEFVAVKRKVRGRYLKKLEGVEDISLFPTTSGSSCWFSGVVLRESTLFEETKKLCVKLKEAGIEARTFWKPIHLQRPYERAPRSDVSIAEKIWWRIVTLPCSTNISDDEIDLVSDEIKRWIYSQ